MQCWTCGREPAARTREFSRKWVSCGTQTLRISCKGASTYRLGFADLNTLHVPTVGRGHKITVDFAIALLHYRRTGIVQKVVSSGPASRSAVPRLWAGHLGVPHSATRMSRSGHGRAWRSHLHVGPLYLLQPRFQSAHRPSGTRLCPVRSPPRPPVGALAARLPVGREREEDRRGPERPAGESEAFRGAESWHVERAERRFLNRPALAQGEHN